MKFVIAAIAILFSIPTLATSASDIAALNAKHSCFVDLPTSCDIIDTNFDLQTRVLKVDCALPFGGRITYLAQANFINSDMHEEPATKNDPIPSVISYRSKSVETPSISCN